MVREDAVVVVLGGMQCVLVLTGVHGSCVVVVAVTREVEVEVVGVDQQDGVISRHLLQLLLLLLVVNSQQQVPLSLLTTHAHSLHLIVSQPQMLRLVR